jgi:hypothetical protein
VFLAFVRDFSPLVVGTPRLFGNMPLQIPSTLVLFYISYSFSDLRRNNLSSWYMWGEERRGVYRVLVGEPEGKRRDHLEDLCVHGRIILR